MLAPALSLSPSPSATAAATQTTLLPVSSSCAPGIAVRTLAARPISRRAGCAPALRTAAATQTTLLPVSSSCAPGIAVRTLAARPISRRAGCAPALRTAAATQTTLLPVSSSCAPGIAVRTLAARPISRRAGCAPALRTAAAASSSPFAVSRAVPEGGPASPLLAVPVPDDEDADAAMDGGDGGEQQTGLATRPVVAPPRPPPERDFAGTPYVPVYVMLPLGVVSVKGEVAEADELVAQLRVLKAAGVDGVMVDCWWGNVEAHRPQEYNWAGYKRLFHIIRDLKLKLQVVMSFHECGGNVGDDVSIPLPEWVIEIGKSNPDIYFTDREGRRNTECLSWGIDKERVLQGRTAVEVYFDFMRSFRVEFDEYFEDGIISEIEVGLGACGELRYPSYAANHGWKYPGIGEFQCYDRYLQKNLRRAAEARGHAMWAKSPDNAGHYNSEPNNTGFFCDGGDYDSYYGRFFLNWYAQVLLDHADRVLMLARLAFEGSAIAVKVSGIHWWYKTASHAAELTAGFYNPCNRDGYAPIAQVLKKHGAALNFTCVELRTMDQHEVYPEALADPEGLVWQVLNAAWDAGIQVASENALPCYDRDGFNKTLENAKPRNDPDGRHLFGFTYLRLCSTLFEGPNLPEFERFVKRMHGEAVHDLRA
ncbi:beta-amylase 2, chloroplastic isoform X1 [Triticum aestivum]|uniref:beta-amylase 2, chloroplastic isoform X1 n=1 Tax=Triticum aestivum TaxID=4565 RepID=UPI001D0086A4|nr:beta-amylase 2, chloroplastic-like isoform X1 [Triticum aestivum]